jgi:hypothetical protein
LERDWFLLREVGLGGFRIVAEKISGEYAIELVKDLFKAIPKKAWNGTSL